MLVGQTLSNEMMFRIWNIAGTGDNFEAGQVD
jgi:hypothetical protein